MRVNSAGQYGIPAVAVFLLLAVILLLTTGEGFAAGEEQARSGQIEATVIHVDQYAVYAPNLIFYFDPQMDKRKISSLTRVAEQMRNKKALITFSSLAGTTRDKHLVLVDLAPAGQKTVSERPSRPAPVPDAEAPTERVTVPKREAAPVTEPPIELQVPPRRPAPPETPPPSTAGRSSTISRAEITEFIQRVMELNGRKDLGAVMPFYADEVDYYDRGVVSRDYVKRDLGYYFRNWDKISTSVDGDVVVIVLDQPNERIAKFISSFWVQNEKKSLTGRTENIWRIRKVNGQLKLFDVKQKIVR